MHLKRMPFPRMIRSTFYSGKETKNHTDEPNGKTSFFGAYFSDLCEPNSETPRSLHLTFEWIILMLHKKNGWLNIAQWSILITTMWSDLAIKELPFRPKSPHQKTIIDSFELLLPFVANYKPLRIYFDAADRCSIQSVLYFTMLKFKY